MERYRLTADELFVIELIFLAFEGKREPIVRWNSLPGHSKLRPILLSLQEKQILLKSYKIPEQGTLDLEALQFNNNFIKVYRKTSGELGEELFRAYPNEMIINGVCTPLRNYAKSFKDEEEFFFAYGKAIG